MHIQDPQKAASGTELIKLKKKFTPDQIQEKKDKTITNLQKITELEIELANESAVYRSEIKQLGKANTLNVRHVTDGFEYVEKLWLIVRDEDNQQIQYVDPDDGEVVHERPMKQEEKQLRMKIS